jgi:uncharacterized membrane protein required for colicin V production
MNWPDVLAVVLVLLAAVVGLRRGFWLEFVLLLGVILAVLTSAWVTPRLSVLVPVHGAFLARAVRDITFVCVGLLAVGIYTWLGERTRGLVPDFLVPVDRVLGGLLGAVKGAAVLGLVSFALLQPWVPARTRGAVGASHLVRVSVLMDAIALDRLALRFPALRGFANAVGQSLHPTPAQPGPPSVLLERTGRILDA